MARPGARGEQKRWSIGGHGGEGPEGSRTEQMISDVWGHLDVSLLEDVVKRLSEKSYCVYPNSLLNTCTIDPFKKACIILCFYLGLFQGGQHPPAWNQGEERT